MLKDHSKNFKRTLTILICLTFITSCIVLGFKGTALADKRTKAKNVIMLIPDGTSIEAITLARWYNGGQPLAMDEIASGLVRTYWKNGPITDSAPGSTAYSTGHKTSDKYVGVLSEEEGSKPVATILEAARLKGKATGVVATSEIMHATPADFTAHDPDRANYNALMKQQVYSGVDVLLGGGDEFFGPTGGGKRGDGIDLRNTIKDLGYDYVTNKEEMFNSKSNKLWGAFAPRDMMYDIDRKTTASNQPSLEEMTKKALEVLSKDKDGFFLMVEGSKVDWAAHANDPVGLVSDIAAFDKAVAEALAFAKKDGHTVVVVAADHGTGGPSIGSPAQKNYSSVTFEETVNNLKPSKYTSEYASELLKGADDNKIREALRDYYGIKDPKPEEITLVKEGKINKVISARANVGWIYGGHVGGDVALYNYAPNGVEELEGVKENTEVSKYMTRVLGLNLNDATSVLFTNGKEAFEKIGASVEIDTSDADNPKAKVTRNGKTMVLPINTNKAEINGKVHTLKGVTVCIKKDGALKAENLFVPAEAVELIK